MTKVKVFLKDKEIYKVELSGHAFYAKSGEDIVCSAISVLCYTIGNKLLTIEEDNIKVDINEGSFKVESLKSTYDNQLLFDTLVMGLKMIEEQYEKFLKIKEVDYV